MVMQTTWNNDLGGCAVCLLPGRGIGILDGAVELCKYNIQQEQENKLNTNETLLMEIYFQLACCKESISQVK